MLEIAKTILAVIGGLTVLALLAGLSLWGLMELWRRTILR
jgi:hypothetical protein